MTAAVLTGALLPSAHAASLGDLFDTEQSSAPKFLPVDEAFSVIASSAPSAEGTRLSVAFDITPGHYVYKDRIKLTLPEGVTAGAWQFNQSVRSIDDPQFGRVPVFDQTAVTATTILRTKDGKAMPSAAINIQWQGCAKAGLCYPPENVQTRVSIAASKTPAAPAATPKAATQTSNNASNSKPSSNTSSNSNQTNKTDANNASSTATVASTTAPTSANTDTSSTAAPTSEPAEVSPTDDNMATPLPMDNSDITAADSNAANDSVSTDSTNSDNIAAASAVPALSDANSAANSDIFGLAAHPFLAMLLLFMAGLGLALTPCVLPMLPIVANIVARQNNPTLKKSLLLTTSYALGVAIAYGLLGALIAYFGAALGIVGWLQNPVILIGFAIVFVLLALHMLGAFSVRLPSALTRKMQSVSQAGDAYLGSTGGSLVAGFLSALVVSPCVSAPLSGALTAVSTIGSPLLGFAALFMLGFGLSVPLIIVGATQGKVMPKAGVWMDWVKQGFAFLLFAVAFLLLERVFVSSVMLMIWALWFMVIALWSWRWVGRGRLFTQAFALIVGIWSACLVVGAALGNTDVLNPLASISSSSTTANSSTARPNEVTITTLAELDRIVQSNERVLVDLTADWCVECRIMDKNLFHTPPAQMADWQLVRLDITDTTPESKAILERYQLFGPPALLYYRDGQLALKQMGEVKRDTFEQALTQLN
ncbi:MULTISPECIES: protein-disulfide reductase DsbD [unclassified Psychrobacter]|uniref:protein-disulfide reductase DsbD n=1 Tax=unclassified Psychrobacter TaxID=196806 RepID=UPI001D1933FA|nr:MULTISPECIES: protein-disulfide reductase DsbD [unclassified Psychrobacter]